MTAANAAELSLIADGQNIIAVAFDDNIYLRFALKTNNVDINELEKLLFSKFSSQTAISMLRTFKSIPSMFAEESVPELTNELPGIEMLVKHPARNNESKLPLRVVIINLNDRFNWSREEIADWIETLDEVPVFEARKVDNGKKEYSPITVLAEFKPIL